MMRFFFSGQLMVRVADLDVYGRGVARDAGQVVFIEGALPGEEVAYRVLRRKKRFVEARVSRIDEPSAQRVVPRCRHYETCGGCALQHLSPEGQRQAKEALWRQQLQRIGGIAPQRVLPPIAAQTWGYRSRTRLRADYQTSPPQVGFLARGSHTVVALRECPVLADDLARVLPSLPSLLQSLLPQRVQRLSLLHGEAGNVLALEGGGALPVRRLRQWADEQAGLWSVAADGRYVVGQGEGLFYTLPDFSLRLDYAPQDFTQVHRTVNRVLVAQVAAWVREAAPSSAVDFFAGLGNFSLPLARLGVRVEAVEGVAQMAGKIEALAQANGLTLRARQADLFKVQTAALHRWQQSDLWLLDPPRAGAKPLLQALKKDAVRDIIYVSCDSATLARDAALLREKGYAVREARIADMFAQTAHVESVLWFGLEGERE